jgi:8-oxo-dGTP pyrophosphatase MutT (NUDIX family)
MKKHAKEASFAIIIDQGKLLLTLRRDVPLWVLPGGGIDPGESPEKACLREVLEETGLQGTILKKTHTLIPANVLAETTHLYLVKKEGVLTPSSPESKLNAFFPLDALPTNTFWPHALWVKEALKADKTIERPLSEISWKNLILFTLSHPLQLIRFILTRVALLFSSLRSP